MRRLNFVPSARLLQVVFTFVGLLLVGLMVFLIVIVARTQDRLERSETTTAALSQQLRQMGVEPEVDVAEDDRVALVPGPAGDDGADGTDGADGRPGITGRVGPRGAAGERGPVGPPGRDGDDGATGSAGATGSTGATGQAGPQGATGPAGERGETGPAGPAGPVGPQGPAGADGPACPPDYAPRERNVVTTEAPLGEPVLVCVPEAS